MKLKPLKNSILIKKVEKDEVVGGIILPEIAREAPQEATVLATGDGNLVNGVTVPLLVKVGDKVLISRHGGTEIKDGEETVYLIKEDDILAIIK